MIFVVAPPVAGGCGVGSMVAGYWCGAGHWVGGDGAASCFTLRMVRYGPFGGPLPPLSSFFIHPPFVLLLPLGAVTAAHRCALPWTGLDACVNHA